MATKSVQGEDIYSALMSWNVARHIPVTTSAVALQDLLRFRLDPEYSLSGQQEAYLFSNPETRRLWALVKAAPVPRRSSGASPSLTTFAIPYMAAAADLLSPTAEIRRPVQGGELICTPASGMPEQYYLIVNLTDEHFAGQKCGLIMEKGPTVIKRCLGIVDADHSVQVLLDLASPSDQGLFELIKDTASSGELLLVPS